VLEELHVRDLALIEESWIEFGPGLTALTGETGAGKTVLLGALQLLLGERADSSAVRTGAREALVEGRFASADREVIARRRVGVDGRSKCTLDGEMATVGVLAQTVGPLVDLHGQHDHQALLVSSSHVGYLDRWIGEHAVDALGDYLAEREAWREAVDARTELAARISAAAADADALRFLISEVDAVAPVAGEDVQLESRLPSLTHAEKLSQAAAAVVALLRGDDGALDRIGQAREALAKVAGIDPALDEIAARLGEAATLTDDCGQSARVYRDSVEHDPEALDTVQARLAALSGIAKRFGPTLDDVIRRRQEAAEALGGAHDSEAVLAAAQRRVEEAELRLRSDARHLAELRAQAAPEFTKALAAAVADLEMPGARFEVSVTALDFDSWTAAGSERIEFLYAPAPSQTPKPLSKIASGGEMSRVMLALKSVLGSADTVGTLVFDEVDAGIGGATAIAVGRRLAELARTHQVIVVTHLAQVAAFADAHYVVRKLVAEDSASTMVAPVEGASRVAEIARMLSGNESEASIAHARELLEIVGR
jgi:DNA repair protein RecN (Recombination protein N)